MTKRSEAVHSHNQSSEGRVEEQWVVSDRVVPSAGLVLEHDL